MVDGNRAWSRIAPLFDSGKGRDLGVVQNVHYSYFTCEYEIPQ